MTGGTPGGDAGDGMGTLAQLFSGGVAVADGTPLETLKEQLAAAQAALGALQTQLSERTAQRDALAETLEANEGRLADYRGTLASLEASGTGEDTHQRVEGSAAAD